ncbi:hypothetical protein CWN88_09920 [Vibrio splendidus]|uniref:hypothetical protein n=1 Tax=Vibrio splendidus TaxID=29497 RepID=UPI000D38CD5E|nr:hypothetical protein [Vibrio splendidus]PTP02769.1 hypothetical protein CWN88_09920 [Vibrio splendidus]
MKVIEQAFKVQKQHDLKERFERDFFEGCVKAEIIKSEEIDKKSGRYKYLKKFFTINSYSINFYQISESQSEVIDSEKELEERLSNIFKVLAKKLIESIPVDELHKFY